MKMEYNMTREELEELIRKEEVYIQEWTRHECADTLKDEAIPNKRRETNGSDQPNAPLLQSEHACEGDTDVRGSHPEGEEGVGNCEPQNKNLNSIRIST